MKYGPTLVVGLAGALAMTVGVAKPWVTATARQSGLPQIEVTVSGANLAPLAGALGVVVLAAFGAVVATRGWVRRGLGVLIVLASARRPGLGAAPARSDGCPRGRAHRQGVDRWCLRHRHRRLALAGSRRLGRLDPGGARDFALRGSMGDDGRGVRRSGRPQDAVPKRQRDPVASSEADVWREIDEGRDPTSDPTDPSRRPGA